MRNLGEFWQKHWLGLVLVGASLIFFVQYLYLYDNLLHRDSNNAPGVLIFNQPDEMANYAFIREWVLNGEVGIKEPLLEISSQVHPRSMTVVDGRLVPIGFPGFIAVASSFIQPLIWLFGVSFFNIFLLSLTPLVAALSSILLYGISRSLGLPKVAALAAGIGLLCLPPWWYYASRPLQANTMFTFFILAGLWAGLRKNEKLTRFFLIGLSFGLALYLRPSEWVWVFGIIILLGIYNREFFKIKTLVAFGLGSGLMVLVFFLTQFAFYGSWLGSGYVRPNADGSAGLITAGPQGIYWLKALLLPFGFDGLAIAKTLYHYGFKLFLPWTVAAGFGFLYVIVDRKAFPLLFKYSLSLISLGLWLALYYGSWQFSDNLAGQVSIGSSQVRYFLPLYVLSIPLIAYLLFKLLTAHWTGKIIVTLIILSLFSASYRAVYTKFEGLSYIWITVDKYYGWRQLVLESTPPDAVIVTRYADKYLFPHRPVIATIDTSDGLEAVLKLLGTGVPVYWYDLTMKENEPISASLIEKKIGLDKPVASWENLELREMHLIK